MRAPAAPATSPRSATSPIASSAIEQVQGRQARAREDRVTGEILAAAVNGLIAGTRSWRCRRSASPRSSRCCAFPNFAIASLRRRSAPSPAGSPTSRSACRSCAASSSRSWWRALSASPPTSSSWSRCAGRRARPRRSPRSRSTIVLENIVRFIFGNDCAATTCRSARDWRFGDCASGRSSSRTSSSRWPPWPRSSCSWPSPGSARRCAPSPTIPTLRRLQGHRRRTAWRGSSIFIGMGLAGIGGMLIGLDTSIDPLTGFRVVLSVFAAAVSAGSARSPARSSGALVIGVAEELSLLVAARDYRTAVGFVAILLVLTSGRAASSASGRTDAQLSDRDG